MQLFTLDPRKGPPFYFNLSNPVGKGYPNARQDDVSLVQFLFAAIASSPLTAPPPSLIQPWSAVKITGVTDDATVIAITAWQEERRARFGRHFEVDGILSVAPPGAVDYAPGSPYGIIVLNHIGTLATPSVWPRLDKHPMATPLLGEAIRSAIYQSLSA